MMVEAELWAKYSEKNPTVSQQHLDKFKHHLKWNKKESILECGVGDSKVTTRCLYPILPKDYKELLLTDISPPMLDYVKKNVDLPKSQVLELDVEGHTFPEEYKNRFDHVFGFYLLHMLKSPRQAIKNIFEMLKPGGQVFLNCFERTPIDDVLESLYKQPRWQKYGVESLSAYFRLQNPAQQYKQDLEETGFENIVIELDKGAYRVESEEHLTNLLLAVNIVLPKVLKEEKEEYLSCYLDACRRGNLIRFVDENGKSAPTILYKMYVIIATKPC